MGKLVIADFRLQNGEGEVAAATRRTNEGRKARLRSRMAPKQPIAACPLRSASGMLRECRFG